MNIHRSLFIYITFLCIPLYAQTDAEIISSINQWRSEQHAKFVNENSSPLTDEDRSTFRRLKYFRANPKYHVVAKFKKTESPIPFEMETTGDRRPNYIEYGRVSFELNGKQFNIPIFKNLEYIRHPLYKDLIFFPFKDKTNKKQSYGGGRYIYVKTPTTDELIIDFNKSFNPYCLYNKKYACPVVPASNYIDIKIKAGVKSKFKN